MSGMRAHFMDRVIERLVASSVDESSAERRDIEKRLNDPDRQRQPGLSVRLITRNFKQISKRLGPIFKVQYGIIHILAWRRPAKTLCFLALYTALCLWPHLVFVYPLIILLVAVIIPAFYYRHPAPIPQMTKVKKRGSSLFGYFFNPEPNETSIVEDKLNELESDDDTPTPPPQPIQNDEEKTVVEDVPQTKEEFSQPQLATSSSEESKITKSVGLMMNMRDFQNLTSDFVKILDKGYDGWMDGLMFRDEKLSTLVFYALLLAASATLFFGQFFPWRGIFISSGWGLLIVSHPKTKKIIEDVKTAKAKKQPVPAAAKLQDGDCDPLAYTRELLIVDDSPEIRWVEIWLLERKNVLETKWKFACFSSTLFKRSDPLRLKGKRPQGVDTLAKAHPPHGWKFDFGLANRWDEDNHPLETLYEREWDTSEFQDTDTDGWLYDIPGTLSDGVIEIEYRRKRLSRECFRYARPPQ